MARRRLSASRGREADRRHHDTVGARQDVEWMRHPTSPDILARRPWMAWSRNFQDLVAWAAWH
eukprot:13054768-Heterocapsa_arctica.AAC.1